MTKFFEGLRHIHFVGVGGVSMSKLCAFTAKQGIKCTGSDVKDSAVLAELGAMGVKVVVGEDIELAHMADLVVYSSAVRSEHGELAVARRAIERKCYLAEVAKLFDKVIAVSGTHGKTTVSSMLAWVLRSAGVKVTAHIGGDIIGENNLALSYGRECFVTEACEYSRSFLELTPDIGVILNVDYDHPDCYRDMRDTYLAFSMFAEQSRTVIYANSCGTEVGSSIPHRHNSRVITYGLGDGDYIADNICVGRGVITFDVLYRGKSLGKYTIYTYNEINVQCALAVICIAHSYGICDESIRIALATFPGVHSRFECLGKLSTGARLISDYAHHPREIETVIRAGRNMTDGNVITVFEPHTFSRTRALMQDFVSALAESDCVVILPTYKAREISAPGEGSLTLCDRLSERNGNVIYADSYATAREYILTHSAADDVVLAVGAGLSPLKLMG